MSSFLLLLNFVLNGIAILAIINLYLLQNRLLETEKKLERTSQEMEEVISSYLFEMKEENEVFMKRFQQMNVYDTPPSPAVSNDQTIGKATADMQMTVKESNKKTASTDSKEENILPRIEHTSRLQAINTYRNLATSTDPMETEVAKERPVANEATEEKVQAAPTFQQMQMVANEELSLYDEIQKLQKEGYTADQIAKNLSKGKTEIELMMKLRPSE